MAGMQMADTKETALLSKWEATAARYEELNKQLLDQSVLNQPAVIHKLNKERPEIEELAHLFSSYQDLSKQLLETEQMLKDPAAEAGMQKLAPAEVRTLQDRLK